MHCAVPFFCARSGTEAEAAWRCGGGGSRLSVGTLRSLWACVGAAGMWQEGRGRACRCAGAGAGFRRGMCCGGGEECIAQPAGVRLGCVGERKYSGRARRCAGAGADLRRGMGCGVGGFNALSPQRLARTRIIIIRPPRHRREIKAMGPKDAPYEHPSPAKTSAPAPSAFIFPRWRSPSPAYPLASRRMTFAPAAATFALPRRRSHFPRMAFGGAHEDFGLPQQ